MDRKERESREYSYVDLLERVSDGVHVQVVDPRKRRPETGRADEKAPVARSSDAEKNSEKKKKRTRDRHHRS